MYEVDNPNFIPFKNNREIILKARQMGFTTRISAQMFLDTMNVPNTQSIIVAQDEVNSKRIFQMIKRYYDNLPEDKKRKATTDAAGELRWGDIDSAFFVGWAGSKKIGRGGTINNIHFSEAAFYENAAEIISGLLQTVPIDGNVFLESTANGVGNYFYLEYQAAVEGESVYKPRFYPWFTEPNYRARQLVNGKSFVKTDEEAELAERYNLDDEQLIWRRNKILELKNVGITSETSIAPLFQQEYPSNADEAFLVTGASFFNVDFIVKELMPNVQPPLETEVPARFSGLRRLAGTTNVGKLSVWKRPVDGKRYLITADPSEGINTGGDHDYCGTHVLDADSWEQVATLHGRWEPHEYAGLLVELGKWYNDALLVVERNNHGHSVLNSLINHYEYPKQNGCSGIYSHKESKTIRKPGFPTNVKTKALALNTLQAVIDDGSIKINEKATLNELKMYQKLPGNKFGCLIGHDDRVTSLAIGVTVLSDGNFTRKMERQSKRSSGKIKMRRGITL